MYYYKDSSKNTIYIKSLESLKNLISQEIINQNTQIRIGLRGEFQNAEDISEIKDLFSSSSPEETNESEIQNKTDNDLNLEIDVKNNFSVSTEAFEVDEEKNDEVQKSQTLYPFSNFDAKEEQIETDEYSSEEEQETNDVNELNTVESQTSEKEEINYENLILNLEHSSVRVGFLKAIKLGFANYFNFSGRSSRSEYWFFVLFNLMVYVFCIYAPILFKSPELGEVTVMIFFIFKFFIFIPALSLTVRRLHDIDNRGWWVLIGFIPILGQLALIIMHTREGNAKENRFGKNSLGFN